MNVIAILSAFLCLIGVISSVYFSGKIKNNLLALLVVVSGIVASFFVLVQMPLLFGDESLTTISLSAQYFIILLIISYFVRKAFIKDSGKDKEYDGDENPEIEKSKEKQAIYSIVSLTDRFVFTFIWSVSLYYLTVLFFNSKIDWSIFFNSLIFSILSGVVAISLPSKTKFLYVTLGIIGGLFVTDIIIFALTGEK